MCAFDSSASKRIEMKVCTQVEKRDAREIYKSMGRRHSKVLYMSCAGWISEKAKRLISEFAQDQGSDKNALYTLDRYASL